jgi:hypothetical protein
MCWFRLPVDVAASEWRLFFHSPLITLMPPGDLDRDLESALERDMPWKDGPTESIPRMSKSMSDAESRRVSERWGRESVGSDDESGGGEVEITRELLRMGLGVGGVVPVLDDALAPAVEDSGTDLGTDAAAGGTDIAE